MDVFSELKCANYRQLLRVINYVKLVRNERGRKSVLSLRDNFWSVCVRCRLLFPISRSIATGTGLP